MWDETLWWNLFSLLDETKPTLPTTAPLRALKSCKLWLSTFVMFSIWGVLKESPYTTFRVLFFQRRSLRYSINSLSRSHNQYIFYISMNTVCTCIQISLCYLGWVARQARSVRSFCLLYFSTPPVNFDSAITTQTVFNSFELLIGIDVSSEKCWLNLNNWTLLLSFNKRQTNSQSDQIISLQKYWRCELSVRPDQCKILVTSSNFFLPWKVKSFFMLWSLMICVSYKKAQYITHSTDV